MPVWGLWLVLASCDKYRKKQYWHSPQRLFFCNFHSVYLLLHPFLLIFVSLVGYNDAKVNLFGRITKRKYDFFCRKF
nr:MAG TPA: hypothetical protein [Caudoviricetes sp.]